MKKFLRKQDGFTLMELMVSIAIISILMLGAVPLYSNSQESARASVDETNVYMLDKATELWLLNTNGCLELYFALGNESADLLAILQSEKWLRVVPVDPWNYKRDYEVVNLQWQALGKPL